MRDQPCRSRYIWASLLGNIWSGGFVWALNMCEFLVELKLIKCTMIMWVILGKEILGTWAIDCLVKKRKIKTFLKNGVLVELSILFKSKSKGNLEHGKLSYWSELKSVSETWLQCFSCAWNFFHLDFHN